MNTIKMVSLQVTLIAAAVMLGGCGGADESDGATMEAAPEPSEPAPAEPGSNPVQACMDVADAFATAAARCGYGYKVTYNAFERAIGGCANTVGVRDMQLLYDDCIPLLKSLTCDELIDPTLQLPESCRGQFVR